MSGPTHWPLIAWSRRELEDAIRQRRREMEVMEAELERRGDRDEKRHGFAVPEQDWRAGGQSFAHYATPPEAHAAALEAFPELHDAAPYRVHPVYLGKDDPA